jgi:general secretion pathway protein M
MNGFPRQATAGRLGQGQTSGLAAAKAWWAGLQPREQQLLGIAGAVVGIALLWLVAIQPAWQLWRQAPARLAALDAQTLAMQRLAAEARGLRGAAQVTAAQSAAALRDASARLGSVAKLSVQGDRAVLTVEGLSSEDLRSWLAEVRSGARARAVEAQLTRGPAGFSGTITLALLPAETL